MCMNVKQSTYVGVEAVFGANLRGWYCGTCKRYFGVNDMAETLAARCCATDRHCEDCGNVTGSKDRTVCRDCYQLRMRKRWEEFELVEWNGEPVADYMGDWFGFDEESVLEYVAESPDCCLVVAVPHKPREIDLMDHLCDFLPTEEAIEPDVPSEVSAALGVVNDWIRDSVFSYVHGKKRVIIKSEVTK